MILGIGADLCDVGRIERALERFGGRFAGRILVPSELERFRRHRKPAAYLAKRFAAKEAFSKALGTGIRFPVNWHGVWVVNERSGKPSLKFSGALAAYLKRMPRDRKAYFRKHHDKAHRRAFVRRQQAKSSALQAATSMRDRDGGAASAALPVGHFAGKTSQNEDFEFDVSADHSGAFSDNALPRTPDDHRPFVARPRPARHRE